MQLTRNVVAQLSLCSSIANKRTQFHFVHLFAVSIPIPCSELKRVDEHEYTNKISEEKGLLFLRTFQGNYKAAPKTYFFFFNPNGHQAPPANETVTAGTSNGRTIKP